MVSMMAVTNVASAELVQGIDSDFVIIGNAPAPNRFLFFKKVPRSGFLIS
jgi:hypothetical protein